MSVVRAGAGLLAAIMLLCDLGWTQQRVQPNRVAPADNRPAGTAQRPAAGGRAVAQPNAPNASNTPNANERLVQEVYLNQFQIQVGVSSDQFTRIQPMLMMWLNRRRNLAAQRNNAIVALKQLIDSGAPEDDIVKQVATVDQTDPRLPERQLITRVDPELTPIQRARFRVFLVDIEQYIRGLIENSRQPARGNRQQ